MEYLDSIHMNENEDIRTDISIYLSFIHLPIYGTEDWTLDIALGSLKAFKMLALAAHILKAFEK